ncbi:hypothetical protein JXA70_03390 [candidate division KSB1 bacterium]|nr:hypothetical protein [candidate division KSB1 bacterium]
MPKKSLIIFFEEVKIKCALALFFLLMATVALVAKPKGESTVVGCLIVEVIGSYPQQEGPVYNEHDIRIDCEYLNKKGKTKRYSYMTKVDESGYFKLERVPAGEYVLKAVEFTFERTGRFTLASKFGRADNSDDARYWGMMTGMMMDNAVDLQQDQIDVQPGQGLIDLGITYIQLNASEQATETGMPYISPDGRPPWQRITVKERGATVDLYVVSSSTFASLDNRPLGQNGFKYTKPTPAAYFDVQ